MRREWLILAAIQLSNLQASIDETIVNIALPRIAQDTGASLVSLGWIVIAYNVANIAFLPISGRLADLYGRRRFFIGGFVVFTLASLAAGLAPNLGLIITARIFQSIGAACLLANGSAMSAEIFTGGLRGIALGLNSTVNAAGFALGYTLGGVLIDHFHWRSVFLIHIPVGLLAIVFCLLVLPRLPRAARGGVNPGSVVLLAAGIGPLLYGFQLLRDHPVFGQAGGIVLAGALLIAAFVWNERRSANRLFPVELIGNPSFRIGIATVFLFCLALAATTLLLSFYIQGPLAGSAAQAGLALAFFSPTMSVFAPATGWMATRRGGVWLIVSGFALAAILAVAYATLLGPVTPLLAVSLGQVVLGLAAALFFSPNRLMILSGVAPHTLGTANSLIQTVRFLAYAIASTAVMMTVDGALAGHGGMAGLLAAHGADAANAFLDAQSACFLVVGALMAVGTLWTLHRALTRRKPPLSLVSETLETV